MLKPFVVQQFPAKEDVLERFNTILEIIADDEVAVSLLEKLLEAAERYFGTVVKMEAKLKMARLRLDGEELRFLTETLDRNRKMAHDSLISSLHIFNRYLIKEHEDAPVGGIFSKDPEAIRDRAAVGDWAGELLSTLYQRRKR